MRPLELTIRRKLYRRPGAPPLEAVRGLSLRFPAGTTTALLGPSGCGKSTALRILMGLDADFEGEVRNRPHRLGVVFQEPRLLPWRTLEENLLVAARAAGVVPPPPAGALLECVGSTSPVTRPPRSTVQWWHSARISSSLWLM